MTIKQQRISNLRHFSRQRDSRLSSQRHLTAPSGSPATVIATVMGERSRAGRPWCGRGVWTRSISFLQSRCVSLLNLPYFRRRSGWTMRGAGRQRGPISRGLPLPGGVHSLLGDAAHLHSGSRARPGLPATLVTEPGMASAQPQVWGVLTVPTPRGASPGLPLGLLLGALPPGFPLFLLQPLLLLARQV